MENDKSLVKESGSFLGTGWGFPPTFTKGHNGVEMISDEQDIRSSLEILLATELGERVLRPEYGTKIHSLIFETLDVSTGTLIADEIRKAILFHESRVDVQNIDFIQDEVNGKIQVTIDYTIITTNTRLNLVFPLFINEGTDIQS